MRYMFGDCTLDTERYELHPAGVRIPVRSKVFQLLAYLIAHRDRVVVKDELIARLWPQQFVGDAALKSCIMTARKAVGDTGRRQRIIQTLHGHGYRFVAEVTTGTRPVPVNATLAGLSGASAPPALRAEPRTDPVIGVPRSAAHTLEQEHKQVTVLWCTLAHATRLAIHLGPEVMHNLMHEVLTVAQCTMQRYEGTITQYLGDGFLALFGAPVAHEDHARRAVLAALELQHLQAAEFLYETRLIPELTYTFKHVLTQEVAYNAVVLERRRVLHERVAQAIEGLCADRLPEHYHTQAHHYSHSGNSAKAVHYLSRAGQQAVEHSAYAEAVSHLTTALDLLTALPETRERHRQELAVQMTLGMALGAPRGQAASEVERLYSRARALCEQVGEPSELFRALWGLWRVYNQRGEYQMMRVLGEQLFDLAQRLQDADLLLEAHHAVWGSLVFGGELAAAQPHLEQGLRLYEPQRHRTHAALYSGHDPGMCCRVHTALALWLRGCPDQAVASSQAALALTQQLAHPLSLVLALIWAATVHHLRREAPLTQAQAEAAMTIATDQGFPQQLAQAMSLRGWVLVAGGQGEEGITQIHQGLAAYRATGWRGTGRITWPCSPRRLSRRSDRRRAGGSG